MLLSELYSDYTASSRRVWLNIKQRHYAPRKERSERNARDAERPWRTMKVKEDENEGGRMKKVGIGESSPRLPRVTTAARVLLRVKD